MTSRVLPIAATFALLVVPAIASADSRSTWRQDTGASRSGGGSRTRTSRGGQRRAEPGSRRLIGPSPTAEHTAESHTASHATGTHAATHTTATHATTSHAPASQETATHAAAATPSAERSAAAPGASSRSARAMLNRRAGRVSRLRRLGRWLGRSALGLATWGIVTAGVMMPMGTIAPHTTDALAAHYVTPQVTQSIEAELPALKASLQGSINSTADASGAAVTQALLDMAPQIRDSLNQGVQLTAQDLNTQFNKSIQTSADQTANTLDTQIAKFADSSSLSAQQSLLDATDEAADNLEAQGDTETAAALRQLGQQWAPTVATITKNTVNNFRPGLVATVKTTVNQIGTNTGTGFNTALSGLKPGDAVEQSIRTLAPGLGKTVTASIKGMNTTLATNLDANGHQVATSVGNASGRAISRGGLYPAGALVIGGMAGAGASRALRRRQEAGDLRRAAEQAE